MDDTEQTPGGLLEQNGKSTPKTETPYRVGNKNPPLHTQFKKGVSGNPKGRPKKKPSFHEMLLRESHRGVTVTRNGRRVKVSQLQLLAANFFKSGITGGPQATKLLLTELRQAEAMAEAKANKKQQDMDDPPFSWTREQEELLRELERLEASKATTSTEGADDNW